MHIDVKYLICQHKHVAERRSRRLGRPLTKIVDERYVLSERRGGGVVRIEAWTDESGGVARYNMAYVNPQICLVDNGRVLGYDNSHGEHHRHERGQVFAVDDFTTYEDLVARFQEDIKEVLK